MSGFEGTQINSKVKSAFDCSGERFGIRRFDKLRLPLEFAKATYLVFLQKLDGKNNSLIRKSVAFGYVGVAVYVPPK